MKSIRLVLLAMSAVFVLSGCFYAHVKQPLDTNVDKTVMGQKRGTAKNYSVLWIAAWGDASTAAAARNGGLTTVNHMDSELYSVLFGLYTESTTIVYGD
jgi:hypothetical protein